MSESTRELPRWLRDLPRPFVEHFLRTPDGQRMVAADAKAVEKEREAAARELAAALSRRETEGGRHEQAIAGAKAEWERLRMVAAEAGRAFDRALDARRSWSWQLDREIAKRRQLLQETADPRIAAFLTELRELEIRTRAEPVAVTSGERDAWGAWTQPPRSTAASIRRRLEGIRKALVQAEALQLEVGIDVGARITELRDAIPSGAQLEALAM